MKQFHFIRKQGLWFIELPDYARKKGLPDPFVPVVAEGFDTLLDGLADGAAALQLQAHLQPFDGAEVMELVQPDKAKEGAYYLVKSLHGKPYVLLVWMSEITRFLFGFLPERIYFGKTAAE